MPADVCMSPLAGLCEKIARPSAVAGVAKPPNLGLGVGDGSVERRAVLAELLNEQRVGPVWPMTTSVYSAAI